MDTISFDDFKKLEIRIGKIISAEKVECSDKLLKLRVDFGSIGSMPGIDPTGMDPKEGSEQSTDRDIKQIIAGIARFYTPEALMGKECPFAYNLATRTLKGLESQGMILCPSDVNGPVLLHPDKEIPPGSMVK